MEDMTNQIWMFFVNQNIKSIEEKEYTKQAYEYEIQKHQEQVERINKDIQGLKKINQEIISEINKGGIEI